MLFRETGRSRIYRRHNECYAVNNALLNMIVSVVVVSWCGQGFSMMVVPPWWELTERSVPRSTGMRYRSITLFHSLTSLVESFSMTIPGHTPHEAAEISTAKQRSCLTMANTIGRFVISRTRLGHPGSKGTFASHYRKCSWLYRINGKTFHKTAFKIVLPPCDVVVKL